ncbi:hypothetical protein [Sphingomicrobium aestuariivivum]|uniref:hypothetical protein n=1 Tax=Sphingomicrobium aestuariivivum TaxID=1582356 RepID=UPI001FD63641|nr:hypothetical protein [Sphingomicrobium aestuariivivum]MCJ8190703.1 hypothetical protein [Sphingomicrobium aestuariivivum]
MNLDPNAIGHAAVAALLIFLTVIIAQKSGWVEKGKWSWQLFFAVFFVMLGLNLFWMA